MFEVVKESGRTFFKKKSQHIVFKLPAGNLSAANNCDFHPWLSATYFLFVISNGALQVVAVKATMPRSEKSGFTLSSRVSKHKTVSTPSLILAGRILVPISYFAETVCALQPLVTPF